MKKMIPHPSFLLHHNAGYSLIQMAIALLVLGLLSAGFIQIYNRYQEQQNLITTQEKVEKAVQQLQVFRQANGYYPCPAPIDAARTDATYGNPSDCTNTAQAIGTCQNGICIQSNTRVLSGANTVIRVRYGALPFRQLQMDEDDTFDAYGSRLSYALTESMGLDTTFNEGGGGIAIQNERGESLIDPPASAAFIVLSHGKNRIGAVSSISATQTPCPTGVAAANQFDAENCFDPTNVPAAALFVNTLETNGTGPNFDDVVSYFASAENKLWRRSSVNINNITTMTNGNVGIGQFSQLSPPPSTLSITQTTVDSVSGLMKTTNTINPGYENGALKTNGILTVRGLCDQTGTKCFYASDFQNNSNTSNANVYEKLKCPNGTYPVGITSASTGGEIHAAPVCRALVSKCAGAGSLTGLNADGSPKCDTVANSCPTQMISLCNKPPQTLAAGPNGTLRIISYTVPNLACASANYMCSNGTWIKTGGNESLATCTNAPINQSCGPGYTGTYSSFTCGGNNSATQCTCTGIPPHTVTTACSSPLTGSTSKTCENTCSNNVLQPETCGSQTGSCTCSLNNTIDFQDCPAGQQRKASPTPAIFTSPVSPWPADIKKGGYRKLTIDTSSCKYDNPGFDTSNCECDGKPDYKTVLKNPNDYPLVNPDYVVHDYCYEPAPGSRDVMDGATLALSSVPYTYAVTKIPKDPATCTANTSQTTEIDPAKFVPRSYHWKTSQAPLRTNEDKHGAGAKELNSGCICQLSANTPATCYKVVAGNKFDIYACSCKAD